MDLSLTEDQAVILSAIDAMIASQPPLPTDEGHYVRYNAGLQTELGEAGFLSIAREEGFGTLDAALIAERVARCAWSVEVAASAIVGPLLGKVAAPLALCEAVGRPTRYLPVARHICLLDGDTVLHGPVGAEDIGAIDTVLSYPIGVLRRRPADLTALSNDLSRVVRTAWQVAIAVEGVGLMRGALDQTVAYVRDRRQFGQPLGDFQAIQHRLAICQQIVSAGNLLALRAAASMDAREAAVAAAYVQQHARTIVYDCHQFTGAMGVTLEYPLHLWTYRLKFLQGELGGRTQQTLQVSQRRWPEEQAA